MIRFFFLTLALLLATPAWAAEGDNVRCYASGSWAVCEWLLCDGDHTPTPTTCTEFDLHTGPANAGSAYPGLPEHIVAEIRTDNCTTANIGTLQGMSTAGGTAHNLSGNLQLGSAAAHVVVDPISHRIVRFNIGTPGSLGVCDDFEVLIRSFNRRFAP